MNVKKRKYLLITGNYLYLIVFMVLILSDINTAKAEPKLYTFNEGIEGKINSVFDCEPKFTGKASVGDDIFVYVWECEINTKNKYAIYKTSYMTRLSNFLKKNDANDFFEYYLGNKIKSYRQNSKMTDIKYSIINTNYKNENIYNSDYVIMYTWNRDFRMIQQGRIILNNGYIADWSAASVMELGIAADEFNNYKKYFEIIP